MLNIWNKKDFEQEFCTEEQCVNFIKKIKYPDGEYACPVCGSKSKWLVRKNTYECSNCHRQESLLSGTLFQDTHKPLVLWFRAIWNITVYNFNKNNDKNKNKKDGSNNSARHLQKVLGIKNYKTAWTWLHKLRRIMVHPDRDRLSGDIEVVKDYVDVLGKGKKNVTENDNKIQIGIAMEVVGNLVKRIRIGILTDVSRDSLSNFIQDVVKKGNDFRELNKQERHVIIISQSLSEILCK